MIYVNPNMHCPRCDVGWRGPFDPCWSCGRTGVTGHVLDVFATANVAGRETAALRGAA